MSVPRLLILVLLALLASAALVPFAGRDRAVPVPSPVPERVAALTVLREWDRQRAAAWRRGEPGSLAGLYVDGSSAGAADRSLLATYVDRGLRVTGMRMQRSAVRVLAADGSRIVLEVVDRLVGAAAVGRDGTRIALPRDGWSRRRIELQWVAGGWRVAAVRDQPRAAERTAETSGSWNS